jgi:hypothetical protein
VNPWSLKGVSSSGVSSDEPNLTLFAMMVSRALIVSRVMGLDTCISGLLRAKGKVPEFEQHSHGSSLGITDLFLRKSSKPETFAEASAFC